MVDQYRVPKRQVVAEVVLFGQPGTRVTLFLGENAESHAGPERPSDLLNGASDFIAATETSGGYILLRRDALTCVSVPAASEFGSEGDRAEELAAAQATSMQVETTLEDGSKVRGTIRYLMPEGRSRLIDFLNLREAFLTLRDGDRALLINKQRIARITTLGPR